MELTLTRQAGTQVAVACDGQPSHTFDLPPLPDEKKLLYSPDYPITYGKTLYTAVFPPETAAQRTLATIPERILLVTTNPDSTPFPGNTPMAPMASSSSIVISYAACLLSSAFRRLY